MNKHNERAELIRELRNLADLIWKSPYWPYQEMVKKAAALLEAQPVAVPDGYVLVPVEPTDDMLDCAQDRVYSLFRVDACSIWDAMLSAAPKQQ